MTEHIDQRVVGITQQLSGTIDTLQELTKQVNNEAMQETLSHLKMQLEAPFTFVIVGEVKAGKSSFINALLESEQDICKVAPSPMTDTIQQIVYGDVPSEVNLTPYIKKISQPIEILKEIAIVDTPGTNTIVDHHQEITEKFIPFSDLVVFVFEAKNPYRQSSWDFFDYINEEWRRKIIFVLQQKDLLPEQDLTININGVKEHANHKGIAHPTVFAVSAKMEQEGYKNVSGYQPLRKYLSDNITGGKAPFLKLQNTIATASKINDTMGTAISLRNQQLILDMNFRKEIRQTLDQQEVKTQNQVKMLVENLLASYDNITQQKAEDLSKGLSLTKVLKKSISGFFSKEESINEWLVAQSRDFELQLNKSLRDKLNNGIMDVADDIQLMGKLVDSKIKTSETVLTDKDEIFADIAEKRANVLKELQMSFQAFMNTSENFYDEKLVQESSKMAPNLATGGGIAVVGVIITALVNGAVFDITGGILTTVGIFFASISLGLNKRKILNKFEKEIERGRNKLNNEVTDTLYQYTRRIKERINDNFASFDQHLEKEERILINLKESHMRVIGQLNNQTNQVNTLLKI